jgi:hypothetical protein
MPTSVLHESKEAELDEVQLVRELFEDSQRYHGDFHEAMQDELDFSLSLRHYTQDFGNERDPEMVQPHSLDLFHLLRHKWGQMSRAQLYIECSPVDEFGDADLAEDCRWALEHVVRDRRLGFMTSRRRLIMGALSSRAWVMKVAFDPSIRPWGELHFDTLAPWNFFKPPGWSDIHDITCPWVGERLKVTPRALMKMGKYGWDVEGIIGDTTMSKDAGETMKVGTKRVSRRGHPTGGSSQQEAVEVLMWWFRDDPFEETEFETSPTVELHPAERFYECAQCGETVTFEQLGVAEQPSAPPEMAPQMVDPRLLQGMTMDRNQTMDEGTEEQLESMLSPDDMPEQGPPCAKCGGMMERQDYVEAESSRLLYPDGRLIVVAPSLNRVLCNRPWPAKLRSFPYWELKAYEHPEDAYGQSDVSLLWSFVLIQDATFLAGWDQLLRNVDVILTPKNGLTDADGNRFVFSNEQGSIAYFSDPVAASMTTHFQGSGISPGWPVFLQVIQGAFQRNMGMQDVSLSGPELANATMGAVNTAVTQGEIPIQDAIDQMNEGCSMFLGVVLDYIIGTWTIGRFVRTAGGPEGLVKYRRIAGSDLPYADVQVSVEPKINPIDAQTINAFTQWLGMAADPPAQQVFAQLLNLPPSLVRQYQKARMQMLAAGPPLGGPNSTDPEAPPGEGGGAEQPPG